MKKGEKIVAVLGLILFLAQSLLADQGSFAIYRITTNQYKKLEKSGGLQKIKLGSKPILSSEDIISYSRKTHRMELNSAACKRISVQKSWTPFMVCVGSTRIYSGLFWLPTNMISPSMGEVYISILPGEYWKEDSKERDSKDIFFISFWGKNVKDDPRVDARIFEALKRAGKLKD